MLKVNISNTWKNIKYGYVNVNNVWKKMKNIYTNVNGVWKPLWSYSWYTGNWSNCSAECGGGTQTRTVYCKRNDNVQVDDNFCSGTKPISSQSCNIQECAVCKYYNTSPNPQYGLTRIVDKFYTSFMITATDQNHIGYAYCEYTMTSKYNDAEILYADIALIYDYYGSYYNNGYPDPENYFGQAILDRRVDDGTVVSSPIFPSEYLYQGYKFIKCDIKDQYDYNANGNYPGEHYKWYSIKRVTI